MTSALFLRPFEGPSFAERLTATDNRPSGFDYLRLVLSLGVIAWHAHWLCYGVDPEKGSWADRILTPLAWSIVPLFFALSGFLVAGSMERARTLIGFMGLRAFRIVPALSMEVLLSALILGPIFTALPLTEYYSDREFYIYFLNIIGEIHYYLPGVFKDNPVTKVNGQLWTIPYELVCYVAIAAFAVSGIFFRKHLLLVILGVCYLLQMANQLHVFSDRAIDASRYAVVIAFIAGLVIFRYRTVIKWSVGLFCLSAIVSFVLLSIPQGIDFSGLPVAYVAAYLGLLNPAKKTWLLKGDYSYGLYLYGYPIQQALVAAVPLATVWYWNLALAVPAALVVAVLSWHLVEKPVLNQRAVLKSLENWCLAEPRLTKIMGLISFDRFRKLAC